MRGRLADNHVEELAELVRVLTSKTLSRAPNLVKILGYVCREYFEGRAALLKEYNIAVQALGRPPDFDPTRDSIVRTEVSRLRKRLAHYYATEGASNALRITLPEVGYVPIFTRRDEAVGDTAKTPDDVKTPDAAGDREKEYSEPRPSFFFPAARKKTLRYSAVAFTVAILAFAFVYVAFLRDNAGSVIEAASAEPAQQPAMNNGGHPAPKGAIRINAGSSSRYLDRSGQLWESDRYYSGGSTIVRPGRRIARTFDQPIYQSAREGDFQYDIPLPPGVYDLHLHFAEIIFQPALDSSAEMRRFHVTMNGKPLLTDFDIALDAPGTSTADERVFKDVTPAEDGFLHLKFTSFLKSALLSGIEIIPSERGRMRPIRILAGLRTYYDRKDQFWGPDRYFDGGFAENLLANATGTPDPELYARQRYGNFSYHIPVAPGRYSVTLRFAESNFGVRDFGIPSPAPDRTGSRIFDIYCNRVILAKNFDILKEAGGPNIALEKTFSGLVPNAQGKLVLSFVPVRDYASVRSIEVIDEGS